MYFDLFSLKEHPFRLTPDPSRFYAGGKYGRGMLLDALVFGIRSGEGIIKVVGEVGSGKTMLCRMLEKKLPESIETVYLDNPKLNAREILYAIAYELNLDVFQHTPRLVVMKRLQEYLINKHKKAGSVVVFIEEAQNMPLDTLEEIRMFSNLETHRHKLLQIVLFGQPELDKNLRKKSIRQLRERITHSFYLQALTFQQTQEYLRFRLQAAGCPNPYIFSKKAEKLIAKASIGLTRRINILADKAMLAAYIDSTSQSEQAPFGGNTLATITSKHVKTAIKDSGYQNHFNAFLPDLRISLAALLIISTTLLFSQQILSSQKALDENIKIKENVKELAYQNTEDVTLVINAKRSPQTPLIVAKNIKITSSQSLNTPHFREREFLSKETLSMSRLIPTQNWVKGMGDEKKLTIQLYSVPISLSDDLENYLAELQSISFLQETYICLRLDQKTGDKYWLVLYDDFTTIRSANTTISKFPKIILRNKPYVRNINSKTCDLSKRINYI